jgi:acyl-CoA thioesterase-1
VILELGANDALRGIDPAVTQAALAEIVRRLKRRNIAVLLCGMLAPRNLGPEYGRAFDAIYPALAAAEGLPFYRFFLDGVAADPKLNLPDGMHPNAAGVDVIVAGILPKVLELVEQAERKGT